MIILDSHQAIQLDLQSSPKRQQYGRFLYILSQNHQKYYLKFQQNQQDYQHFILHLQREIQFYQDHAQAMLPYQIFSDELAELCGLSKSFGLILPQAEPLFNLQHCPIQQCQTLLNACQAVQKIWQLGYLHGDLKDEHFVSYHSDVYLLDCEYIQRFDAIMPLHATPHYMSPELFQGQGKSRASELYALGIIFYEWLNGQKLHAKSYYDWAVLHHHLTLELPKNVQIFADILHKMLAKQVKHRYQDIESVIVDLLNVEKRLIKQVF